MKTIISNQTLKIPVKSSHVNVPSVNLTGDLTIPPGATSLVIFSHGSGSSRLSPRNGFVAQKLNEHDIATFLFDLLTEEEDEVYQNRFNIDLLTERLVEVTRWIIDQDFTRGMNIGYFGASTGAASALKAAAKLTYDIKAVVSRGGRPDLAMAELGNVKAPTLLIVGGLDYDVIDLNQKAALELTAIKELVIIQGATHLFEEEGKLDEAAELAANWFNKYLR